MTKKQAIDFFHLYERFLSDMQTGKRVQKNGARIRRESLENYRVLGRTLQCFSLARRFTIRVTCMSALGKREREAEERYWKRFYHELSIYMLDSRKNHDAYYRSQLKLIRAFFNYLSGEKGFFIASSHRQYTGREELPVLALTPERLNFLCNDKEFEAGLTRTQQWVKDVFVFGCAVALRYSDVVRIRRSDIEEREGRFFLAVRSLKTGTYTRVLLPGHAVNIVMKDKRKRNYIFPRIYLSGFNIHLKNIALKAGWTEEVRKVRCRHGIPVEQFRNNVKGCAYRFCDLMSSHMMRKTAITTMLSFGMNENAVRKISGHAPGSKEFYRYVGFSQSYMDHQIEQVYEKLGALK